MITVSNCCIRVRGEEVRFDIDNGHGVEIKVSRSDLINGAVFDQSDGENMTARVWVCEDSIYILHVFGHDSAWPSDIHQFPLDLSGDRVDPIQSMPLHKYLALGGGIPFDDD